MVEEKEEAPTVEVDNITKTIPSGFGPMPCNKKRRLNPPSPNTIMEDVDDSSSGLDEEEGNNNGDGEGSSVDQ